jgi:ComF family protein
MCKVLRGFLALLAPLRCAGCDEPIDAPAAFCDACAASNQLAALPGAVFEYGGPVADAIQRFKYEGRSELATALGALMAEEALRSSARFDAVVPVPLHWRRRRARGYDQAALLAKPVAKALGVPALLRGLRRVRNTPSQVDLPFGERQRNVRRAFAASRLRGARRVLLVDDVRTTGATIRAASEALTAGGAFEVHSLVLAARVLSEAA